MPKNQKKIAKKRKEREKIAKERVNARRKAALKERKRIEQEQAIEKQAHEIAYGKVMPFIKDPHLKAQKEASHARNIAERLKKNFEILEALEEQYEAEQAARSEVNNKLESEGHKSMREKMDALHKKALEMTGKAEEFAKANEEYAAQHTIEEETVEVAEFEKKN